MSRIRSQSRPGVVEQRRQRLRSVVAVVCVLALVAALAFVVPVTPALAQSETDTDAPTLAGAERGNATTIVVTVADDEDVDESSIALSDFDISTGLVRNSTVSESGSNATVRLFLVSPVNTENVTVSLDGSISDATGNVVSSGRVTATGMDGQDPRLLDFGVERLNGTHAEIAVETGEPLSQLTLAIGGANTANLAIDNFSETVANSGEFRYSRVHEFENEGETLVLLMELTDDGDNAVNYNARRDYLVDRTTPTADIDGPNLVTSGDTHRFTSGAADNVAVESVRWSIGPNTTRTGRTITHSFATPGNTTLTATVTDGRGRNVTVSHTVTVVDGASTDGVDVTPVAPNRTNATVFSDRAIQRVRIADDSGHLVSNDGVTIESLTATPPANESLALSVTLDRSARVFTSATGRASIASFSVAHPFDDSAENVTVAFAVDRYRLQSAGLSPEEVALYRLNGTWTERPTRVRFDDADRNRVHFVADAPGLSSFAIGASARESISTNETTETATNETNETSGTTETATNETTDGSTSSGGDTESQTDESSTDSPPDTETPTPEPASLVVTNVSLATDTVSPGGYAVVTATVANRGGQSGSRIIELTANNTTVATRPVTVPAGENRTVQFGVRLNESVPLAVDGTVAGSVSVVDATTSTASTQTVTQTTPTTTASATPQTTVPSDAGSTPRTTVTTTQQGGGGLPNPLSLWPSGLLGTALGAVIGLVTVTYGVLKALAIYLGY